MFIRSYGRILVHIPNASTQVGYGSLFDQRANSDDIRPPSRKSCKNNEQRAVNKAVVDEIGKARPSGASAIKIFG
jgi:hypothetical protein